MRKIFSLILYLIALSMPLGAGAISDALSAFSNDVNPSLREGQVLSVSAEQPRSVSDNGGGGFEVNIYSPLDGKTYGNDIDVIYEVKSKKGAPGQEGSGTDETFVTISFSKTADSLVRTRIGSNLPPKGVFRWNTKDLPEGDTYNIIVSATNKSNETGESISGNFSIDHTSPIFTVSTEPVVTRGEDVNITVYSSKKLPAPPIVRVMQKEFNSFDVVMAGNGSKFVGAYKVVDGYDGPAKIDIRATDLAGNEGSLIVSGGRFSVGVLPPPKPVIISPLDKDIVRSEVVEIRGVASKDTEVVLILNGKVRSSKTPGTTGEFVFSGIKLNPDFDFGSNAISIISRDADGNTSEPADLNLKYNSPPEIFLESPVKGQALGTTVGISIKASDKNQDKLTFKYEVSKDAGATWTDLNVPPERRSCIWDTTTFEDGDYSLRVTVSDGTSKKIATVGSLVIKNLLPTFSFVGGNKTVSNKKDVVISGQVVSSAKSQRKPGISVVEYSLDGGLNWSGVTTPSGLNTPEVKFNVALGFAGEKIQQILFRAKDDRNIYGRGVKTVIVFLESPAIPAITLFKNGMILDDSFDNNKLKAGVQINVEGTSSPNVSVNVKIDGVVFAGETDALGKFVVRGVTLRKHGGNTLAVSAIGPAGNKSGTNELNLIYNNAPILKFINPRQGGGLNHKTSIEFSVFDPDGDEIKRTILSLKKPGDSVFKSLDINSPGNKFEFNFSSFTEGGGYELKLDSTDGVSASSKTVRFFVDNTKPKIIPDNIPDKNFEKDFRLEATGRAEDGLSGIEFVEYSLDGEHWFKSDITNGFLNKRVNFRIRHPFVLDDGEYNVEIRAVDAAGNYSDIWSKKIFVNTMPPRVGSYELSYNGIPMYPGEDGFKVLAGKELKIRASFEADTKKARIVIGDVKAEMSRNADGIWEGAFIFKDTGSFEIKFSAEDNFGNKIENKIIGMLDVVDAGKTKLAAAPGNNSDEFIEGAVIEVLVYSEDRQRFERWPGEYYNINNPVKSDEKGSYSLFLPAGTYQIYIQKQGFIDLKTKEFIISSGEFINFEFNMKKREGFRGFVEDVLEKVMIF